MQFDGFTNQGEKVFKLVKWPKEYHEDPMVLASALRLSLQAVAGNKRRQPAAIKPNRWYQLLSPPAQSWAGFEIQLAQLVEQLILRAREAPEAPSTAQLPDGKEVWASWDAQKTTCDAVSVAQARQAVPRSTEEEAEEQAEEKEEQGQAGGARAAKRARQRERRKLGKALARGEAVEELAAAKGVTVPAQRRDRPKQPEATEATEALELLPGKASEPSPDPGFDKSPKRALETAAAQAAPTTAMVRDVKPAEAAEDKAQSDDAEDDDIVPGLYADGSWAAARGFGRGRPMGRLFEGPSFGLHGRGMGRGRALAPPPGLQGLQLSGSQRMPATLSRPWMAGPPIPEDEDISTPQATLLDTQARTWPVPPLELPLSHRRAWADMDSGSDMSVSERRASFKDGYWSQGQASYVPTPVQRWSKTPSPPCSPAPGLALGGGGFALPDAACGPSAVALAATSAASAMSASMSLAANKDFVIPVYVTVPIAVAKCCPHCGKHFAEMPGPEVVDDT